jgi:hypothetical protein
MKFHRCHTTKSFLISAVVVEIDVVLYRLDKIIPVCKSVQIVHLRFQHPPEALHRAVVVAAAYSGHALTHLCFPELVIESAAGVLEPSVAVTQRMGMVAFNRQESPFMSITWLRKGSQSIKAATIVIFSNSSVHLENGRFVVTMVLLFTSVRDDYKQ